MSLERLSGHLYGQLPSGNPDAIQAKIEVASGMLVVNPYDVPLGWNQPEALFWFVVSGAEVLEVGVCRSLPSAFQASGWSTTWSIASEDMSLVQALVRQRAAQRLDAVLDVPAPSAPRPRHRL